jgi:transposase
MLQKGMSREIRPDYETQLLFPQSLEDWIEPDHPARYVREFVEAVDVRELGLSEEQEARRHDTQGRPHYAVDMLLKLWLYAYMNRIRSSRALEKGCRDVLPLIWLAGRHVPDHNTLWRFWNRYRGTIKHLFLQSVRVAMEQNMVGMVLHALDGTKIHSAASKRTALHRSDLKKKLKQLEGEIERLEEQIGSEGEDDSDGPDDRLPKELEKREALRRRIQESLTALEKADREHLHPLDPDAQMMVSGSGRTSFAYNAQAVVDEVHGVIVSEDVVTEANDQHQLVPMLEQTKENIGEYAQITVTDSGYHAAEALGEAEAMGAHVLVGIKQNDRELGPYHTSRFTYDPATDSVQCPQGQSLPREGTRRHKDKPYPVKTYRCKVFGTCPVVNQCSRDRGGRSIEISPHYDAVMRNRHHPDARALLIRRQSVVERAFAEIKEVLGLRRWSFRGLDKVKAQWSMMCAAMNLRRIMAAAHIRTNHICLYECVSTRT